MSLLEKILWLADYIEPNRSIPGLQEIRELAYLDLDEALRRAMRSNLSYLEKRGIEPHPATREALAFLSRGEVSP